MLLENGAKIEAKTGADCQMVAMAASVLLAAREVPCWFPPFGRLD